MTAQPMTVTDAQVAELEAALGRRGSGGGLRAAQHLRDLGEGQGERVAQDERHPLWGVELLQHDHRGHPHVPVPDDGGQRVGGVPGAQEGLGQPGADVVFAPRCGRPQPVQADPPGDGGEPGPLVTQGRAGVVVERGRVNTCSAGVMTYAAGAGSGSPGHPPSTRVIASRSGGVTHSPYVAFTATCRATYLHQ